MQLPPQLIEQLSPPLRDSFQQVCDQLLDAGCSPDLKTIYVSFTLGNHMVAAAYPHTGRYELALALPEDQEDALLQDATHLTWRTLPVSVDVTPETDVSSVTSLVAAAVERVATGKHEVNRPPEYFAKRPRRSTFTSRTQSKPTGT